MIRHLNPPSCIHTAMVLCILANGLPAVSAEPRQAASFARFIDSECDLLPALVDNVICYMPRSGSASELFIKVLVPEPRIAPARENGQTVQKIFLEGYGCSARPGDAQLPSRAILLAIPAGASVDIEVVRSDITRASCHNIARLPRISFHEESDRPYAARASREWGYPLSDFPRSHSIAEVSSYGYLRDMLVAQIRVMPVQYDPARNELVVHRSIWLRVRLSGGSFPRGGYGNHSPGGKADPFTMLFRNAVCNYHPALRLAYPPLNTAIGRLATADHLGTEAFKVAITKNGIYRIGYHDLQRAGASPGAIDPRTMRLSNVGREVPLLIAADDDGAFDETDCIVFYGCAPMSEYSDTNMYWLSWNGSGGRRMTERNLAPRSGYPIPTSFSCRRHCEENRVYYSTVAEGEGKDHWLWELLVGPCSKSYSFDAPGISAGSADSRLTVKLLGKTDAVHNTQMLVNGEMIGDIQWSGMGEYKCVLPFASSILKTNGNILEIRVPISSLDQVFLNWFEIEYRRLFAADNDTLEFSDDCFGGNEFRVRSFSDSTIDVFCITGPYSVENGAGHSIVDDNGSYAIAMEDTVDSQKYLVMTRDRMAAPARIFRDKPSALRTSLQGADYIIISHEKFIDSILPLADFRISQGLRVVVVDVNDIYDEFNYGNADPAAIKSFLSYCYGNWRRPAPSYVLLVGDASTDYRRHEPDNNENFVPTHLFISQTNYLEAACDDWFVQIVGDDILPDMLIGRFPAQCVTDVTALVDKVIEYENQPANDPACRKIVLLADNPDGSGNFDGICDRFSDNYIIPANYEPTKIYLSQFGSSCREYIMRAMNHGCVMCNYVGHGSTDGWASENIFVSADIAGLSNAGKYPLVFTCACLNGYFNHVKDDYCIAEEFVRAADKGAIACLSHSGMEYPFSSEIMGNGLYDALLRRGNYIIGSAACEAKVRYLAQGPYYWDQAIMLILFGDPALEMGFPGRPDLLVSGVRLRPACPREHEKDTVIATVCNAGRVDAANVKLRIVLRGDDGSEVAELDISLPLIRAGEHVLSFAVIDSVPASGKYPIHIYADPDNEILESCEWNNEALDTLEVCGDESPADTISPLVELFIDGKMAGAEFMDYDFAAGSVTIEAILSDSASGIALDDIQLFLNESRIYQYTLEVSDENATHVRLAYVANDLKDGRYAIKLIARDRGALRNERVITAIFRVSSRLLIEKIFNYPNPFADATRFGFSLSQHADIVSISIFTIKGSLITTIERRNCMLNRNVVCWQARDRGGAKLSSGVYMYRIRARNGGGTCVGSGKMVVMH